MTVFIPHLSTVKHMAYTKYREYREVETIYRYGDRGIHTPIHTPIHTNIHAHIRAHIKLKESDFYLLCLFVTIGMQVACYINAMILIFKVISEYCLLPDNIVVIVQLKCFFLLIDKKYKYI